MKDYSTIKELIRNLEEMSNMKIIDGWKENKYWVSQTEGEFFGIKNKDTGEWKEYQKGGIRIKCLLPK